MDNRICKYVTNSLDVYHDHVSSCDLPRKVAQSLRDKSLIVVRLVHPPSVVVLLHIISFDVVFSVPVLDVFIDLGFWLINFVGIIISYFIYERSNEVSEQVRLRNSIDNSLIERVDYQVANCYKLQVLAHRLDVVFIKVCLLHALQYDVLFQPFVKPLESISVSTLAEWVLRDFYMSFHG